PTALTMPSSPQAGEAGSAPMTGSSGVQFSGFSIPNALKPHNFGYAMRAFVLPLVIAGAITAGLRVSQSYFYGSTPGWEHFEQFNKLRAQFTDYQAAPFNDDSRAVYKQAGWTENDYTMLINWFFENPQLYSIEKFKEILSQTPHPA